jgi:hypothetical protein
MTPLHRKPISREWDLEKLPIHISVVIYKNPGFNKATDACRNRKHTERTYACKKRSEHRVNIERTYSLQRFFLGKLGCPYDA